jgi:ABC-2 type transport system permease protein
VTRFARMLGFHLRLFAKNSYFGQLLITTTLSAVALQHLAALTSHAPPDGTVWLRAGIVGTWTVCSVAAGLIGYQRFQGTLVHLVLSPLPAGRVFLALVASASVFGLVAFRSQRASLPLSGCRFRRSTRSA